jgi:hypothetical protein
MATFSSGVKCFRSFLIRSLRYLNGGTLSPVPTEAGHDAYLQWLEKVLNITDSEEFVFDARMEFKIFASPSDMMEALNRD